MTTRVQSLIAPQFQDLFVGNASATIQPGTTLTNEQAKDALLQATGGAIIPRPATTDNVVLTANAGGNAGNGDAVTAISDPGATTVSYNSGLSQWISNNPVIAGGVALLIAWGIYQMLKGK